MPRKIFQLNRHRGPNRCSGTRVALTAIVLLSSILIACGEPPPASSSEPGEVAKRVIAEFLSLPVTEATLVSLEARDFNDASLGCPTPGMSYAQVITPGFRVVVEADGRRFDVRVSGTHGRICRRDAKSIPPRDDVDGNPADRPSPITSMIDRARNDLAGLLSTEPADIRIVGVRAYREDGERLAGCAPDCPLVAGTPDCGYLIGLFYDGRSYEYHATGERATPCPPILPM